MNEETMMVACKLIADAGDGASKFLSAIAKAESNAFDEARKLVEEGKESLIAAHQQQTTLLHNECQGSPTPLSLLMIHAQDHLMHATTLSELAMTIINLNERLSIMEKTHENKTV